jgi:tetratricopeptide (TPR) repeat protein
MFCPPPTLAAPLRCALPVLTISLLLATACSGQPSAPTPGPGQPTAAGASAAPPSAATRPGQAGEDGADQDAQRDIDRAQILWNEDHPDQAEALLVQVLGRTEGQPGFAGDWARRQARDKLGRLYISQQRYSEAQAVLELSAAGLEEFNEEHKLGWACPYQALGALYAATNQPSQALAYQIQAAQTESMSARAQLDVAILALSAGDGLTTATYLDRAEALAGTASPTVEAPPLEQPQLDVLRGYALLLQRDYPGAEQQFTRGADQGEGSLGARIGLGHLAIASRDYDEAHKQLDESAAAAEAALEEVRPGTDPSGIISDPKRMVLEASYHMACLGQAWIASNHGQHDLALPWYERILARDPSHLLALLGRGNALVGLGRADEAEAVFQQALDRYPDNPYVLAELGLIRFHQGDDGAAARLFERALEHDDGRYTCPHEGLGLVYLRQGRTEAARTSFERAIELNPDIEFAKYNGLARIYIEEGRHDQARELLLKSLANYPYDGEALELLVTIDDAEGANVQ